jgi:hypothetical protein
VVQHLAVDLHVGVNIVGAIIGVPGRMNAKAIHNGKANNDDGAEKKESLQFLRHRNLCPRARNSTAQTENYEDRTLL